MSSFDKIDYLLRPSKQVERKLIIETLQKLSKAGYYVHDYTYLGLGSIFYADFILFHKYLLIDDMICAEKKPIPNRMGFNKPYEFIDLTMKAIGDLIPKLDRAKKHLIWLDYDNALDEDVLSDIRSCIRVVPPGSFLLITVGCDFKFLTTLLDETEADCQKLSEDQKKYQVLPLFNELIGAHYGQTITVKDLALNRLPKVVATSLKNFINMCVGTRNELKYFQLFNYRYSDNAQMLTVGGLIDFSDSKVKLEESGIYNLACVTQEDEPIKISVPPLTAKEKAWLEKNLIQLSTHLSSNPSLPDNVPFEIKAELVKNFVKYYRHYPSYYETLI